MRESKRHPNTCLIWCGGNCNCDVGHELLYGRSVESAPAPEAPTREKQLKALLNDAEAELDDVKDQLRRWVARANELEQRVRQLELEQS